MSLYTTYWITIRFPSFHCFFFFHALFFAYSSLGIPHVLPPKEMNWRRDRTKISLVISHCDVAIDWIPGYFGTKYHIQDITIYSKCGNEVKGLKALKSATKPKLIRLPNVGRCDHSYAHWIKEHYESINPAKDKSDFVFFMKDNNYHQNTYRPIEEVFTLTSELGFGCALRPIWCDCPEGYHQCEPNDGLMLHNKTLLEAFEMRHRHVRLDRDNGEADTFVSDKYPNLSSWKKAMGLVTTSSETVPVCYGGVFAVKKEQFLQQTVRSWRNLEKSLTREDNLVEGHYAERMWAAILSNNDEKYAKFVDKVVLKYVSDSSRCIGRPGMLLIPKGTDILENIITS